MAHPHIEHRAHEQARAHGVLHRTGHYMPHRARGGSVHGDAKADAGMISEGVHEHESAMHKGEPKTKLHFADGRKGKHHLAKRARGGKMGAGKHTKVNVIVAPQMGNPAAEQMAKQQGLQAGMGIGARQAAQHMAAPGAGPPAAPGGGGMAGGPPRAPMGAVPGGGIAPPGAGPAPGMMRKHGGAVDMEAGAGGGEGRIEKTHEYGKGGFKPKDKMPKMGHRK